MFRPMSAPAALLGLLPLLAGAAWGATAGPAPPVVIRPGQASEKPYLVEDHSALREIGSDPLRPFIRIADGETMHYTYRFAPGRGRMAYLLLDVMTQFLISVSADGGKSYRPVSEMRRCERAGTRVLVDLTPFLGNTDAVLVRFEDRYKEDGWGALLGEIEYRDAGPGATSRLSLDEGWQAGGQDYRTGRSIAAAAPVTFTRQIDAPSEWRGHRLALYLSGVRGAPVALRLNGRALRLRRTWDQGHAADVSGALRIGAANRLQVVLRPEDGRAGLWSPVRLGLSDLACAVPDARRLDDRTWRPNRAHEPYTPEKMGLLAGNFLQCLYDRRYDLLAFQPGERMTVHYLHDTLRSLVALAEEERYTPVVRLELARRLYRGCKRGILPGGECLFAFKHDERPIDIRPLPDTPDLALVQKMDNPSTVASVGVSLGGDEGSVKDHRDTPLVERSRRLRFTRTWSGAGRELTADCRYALGGEDTPPAIEFGLDGKGPVRIRVGRLNKDGMWFVPGSWGPEAVVLPDGKALWAHETELSFARPSFRYLLVRGGNGYGDNSPGDYLYCKALLVMWDTLPDRLSAVRAKGGRHDTVWSDVVLEYANRAPARVRLTLMPFGGYPETLKAPRLLAERVLRTGRFGMGPYDVAWTTNCNGIGPDGMAAAAYLLRKYRCPEAKEAEDLALRCMRAFVALDEAGTRTNELYYLVRGCTYLHLLGHAEFDRWMRLWADRILAMQKPDGSWTWLNFQLRCMEALLAAHEVLGDAKYLEAVKKGLSTLEYRDDRLYWKGQVDYYDDFGGALTLGIYGYLGMRDMAAQALRARANYVDDRGFMACSDLNPYMLGLSAHGLGVKTGPKLLLGLDEFAEYDGRGARKLDEPTAYVVNPYHPMAGKVLAR